MRVTKKRKAKEQKSVLGMLATFLNLDANTVREEDLRELFGRLRWLLLTKGGMLSRPTGRAELGQLQVEIQQDLLPIVAPEKVEPHEAYLRLNKFIGKMNRMGFKSESVVLPIDYELDRIRDPQTGAEQLSFWQVGPE